MSASRTIMRQAIETKYLGPTDHRGPRIAVRAQAGRKTYDWDHTKDVGANHLAAATAFAESKGWLIRQTIYGGSNAADTGYVFVLVPKEPSQ